MVDTRIIQHDELYKKSITDHIKRHIDFVTAVLVFANGTVPRATNGTDYALYTLTSIFPKTLARTISFIFTNISSPLHWNYSGDTMPDILKDAPQNFLSNPIAFHRKYNKLKNDPNTRKLRADFRKAVKGGEQDAMFRPYFPRVWIIFELVVFFMKRNRVVEENFSCVFENIWDSVSAEVPMEQARYIGEHEGNILGQGLGEDRGQSGQRVIGADSNARDGAIGEDENGSNKVDMLLDMIHNTLLVELVVLNTASIGQPRCIKDANLGKRLHILTTLINASNHHYATLACELVKAGCVGLALVVRATLLVGVVKDVEVVVINIVTLKNIGDEFQE